jgi:Holliday junction resolvase RusA-like endonuclease
MDKLTVIVPTLPPTINHAYKSIGKGRKALTDEALAFRQEVSAEARTTARMTGWRLPDGPLEFHLFLTYGSNRRTDIDNRVKMAIDAIALAIGFDDARIDKIEIERVGYDKGNPLCEMVLMSKV